MYVRVYVCYACTHVHVCGVCKLCLFWSICSFMYVCNALYVCMLCMCVVDVRMMLNVCMYVLFVSVYIMSVCV